MKGPVPSCPTNILVAALETIKEKNMYQFEGLSRLGYRFDILTTDRMGDSQEVIGAVKNVNAHICDPNRIRRSMISTLLDLLRRGDIHLAEVYPSSYLTLILALLIKLWRVPIIIVARGEEYYYITNRMSSSRRRAFRWTYALADFVIYKELYMKEMLDKMGKRDVRMLSNAVHVPERINPQRPDKCHLLYLNSIKDFRHPDVPLKAFLEICRELQLTGQSDIRLIIVGFMGEKAPEEIARKEAELRALVEGRDVPVELHPWTQQPSDWFDDADVFLLPADVVFLNFSLLEAMARGVPPIVQESDGSERIVSQEEDGYILPLDVEAWRQSMRRLILDAPLRTRLGRAAKEKVAKQFSLEAYLKQYDEIYKQAWSRKHKRGAD